MERPVRYGPEFSPPSRSVMRRHRAKAGVKMFEADEIRAMLDGKDMRGEGDGEPKVVKADPALRAMIFLGVNAGFGNGDCAALPLSAVNLDTGWLTFPRPKTGVELKCWLWPETVGALELRPEPKGAPTRGSCSSPTAARRSCVWMTNHSPFGSASTGRAISSRSQSTMK